MSSAGWVVICELPQWVITIKPVAAVIFEHQQALIGHYPVNPMLVLHRCDTRRAALNYLELIQGTPGVLFARPPFESKPTCQRSSELP